MTDILKLLTPEQRRGFSPTDRVEVSFISEEAGARFQGFFFINKEGEDTRSLFILSAPLDTPKRDVVRELLEASLEIREKGYRGTCLLTLYGDLPFSLRDLIRGIPSDPAGVSGDLEYILRHIRREEDPAVQREMKVNIFTDLLRFILEDDDLTLLTEVFLSERIPGSSF